MTPAPAKPDRSQWAAIGIAVSLLLQTVVFSFWLGRLAQSVDNIRDTMTQLDNRLTYLERRPSAGIYP